MDCASCAVAIERAVGGLEGVQGVQVDVMSGTVRVAREVAYGDVDLASAIRAAGYSVRERSPGPERRPRGPLVAAALSGVLLAAGLALGWAGSPVTPVPFLALSTLVGARYVAPRGWKALRARSLDINFLMTLAAVGAGIIGEWGEAAAAMFLFAVAQLLEGFAMGRARRAIAALMKLAPREATVRRDGHDQVVAVETVRVGEQIVIRPGERLPLDGVVVQGHSALDQSPITGESMPVDKEPGSEVFAGSINGHGGLEVRVTSHAEDTTLARIMHAVEEAQATRAPSQSFVDRFAKVYTPAVVVLAALVAVLPPLLAGAEWATWVYRALALLVIACPCALVISTPVTIVSSLAGAARRGVLIKGGAQLEAAGAVDTVLFDKTGTLTTGRPVVTDIVTLDGLPDHGVLRLAAGVERHSEHPVARAIVHAARQRGLDLPEPEAFVALPGRGARALVEGRTLYIGNRRICEELGTCQDAVHRVIETLERTGRTAVLLTTEARALGVVAIADQPRPGARQSVAALRAAGIARIVMATGDNAAVAHAVAAQLGIEEVRAGLLPAEKHRAVTELRATGARVAVVGDGVNDAPALAAANVGIAMGAAGTHVALETADIVLMGDDLGQVAATIRRSRRTVRIIKQNIAFSIGLKAVFLALALVGQATLWMAVAADMGASLVVIANGLRAMREDGPA
jgi:Cd2+/Zn2+-exporting ATPase